MWSLPHCREESTTPRGGGEVTRGGDCSDLPNGHHCGSLGVKAPSTTHRHPPGFQHKPDHLPSSSRIVRHCIATGPIFTTAALGHLVSQRPPPVFVRMVVVRVSVVSQNWESMICPFVSCISCSTSCDVTY